MPGRKHITRAASPALEGGPGSWVSDAAREKFMAAYDRAFIKAHAIQKQAAQLAQSLRRL